MTAKSTPNSFLPAGAGAEGSLPAAGGSPAPSRSATLSEDAEKLDNLRSLADSYCRGENLPRILLENLLERFICLADEKLTSVASEIAPSDESILVAHRALDKNITTWSQSETIKMAQEILRLARAASENADTARSATLSEVHTSPAAATETTPSAIAWKPGDRRVVCAALLDDDSRLVTGARHFDAVMMEQIKRGPAMDAWRGAEQGFIDQFGKFMTREEAHEIAERQGQIIRRVGSDAMSLFSENLY